MVGMNAWRLGGAMIALIAIGNPAQAQTSAAPTPETKEQTEDRKYLDAISITGTRNPIKAFEYPGMVSVVGREEIQSRQPSTPDDVLKYVPGVEFVGGPRRTGETPTIRGFSGPDVIILFDGARQNFGSAHDGRFFVDPMLLKQVEVLRGTASSLYGSGGTGGVIEFRTVDADDLLAPGETAGVSLSTGYQTVNRETSATFRAFGKPADGFDVVGSVTKRDSGSIELGDGNELGNTDDDIIAGMFKASYDFASHHRIEGAFTSFNNDAQEPNNGQDATNLDSVDKEIRSNTLRATYSYNNPADRLVDLDFVTYYTKSQADELRLDDLGAGAAGELLKRDVDTIGTRLDNRSRFSPSKDVGLTLTYGGEYYRDEQDGAADAGQRDGVPDAEADFLGVYVQGEVAISDPFGSGTGDFLVIPGLRYDDYSTSSAIASENSSDALSPRLGVTYLPTDWLMLFTNYAHAFRAPTFDELFQDGVHFRIPVGLGVTNRFVTNPNLSPQKTRTFEFGGGLTFDDVVQPNDQFQIKSSYFRIKGEDFINIVVDQPTVFVDCNPFIPGACDGTTTTENVPNAKLWGAEIEASYENRRFIFSAGFSKIDGENEDTGAKLGVLTPDEFTFSAGIKIPEIDSIIGWRMLAAGEFDNVNSADEARDGYAVHDLYFTWEPRSQPIKGLRLDLGIDNALDKNYARTFNGATEAGRNYKTLISYSYKW